MSLAFFKEEDVAILGKTAGYPSTADGGNINTRYFARRAVVACMGKIQRDPV